MNGWPTCADCGNRMDPDALLRGDVVCSGCLAEVVDVDEETEAYER